MSHSIVHGEDKVDNLDWASSFNGRLGCHGVGNPFVALGAIEVSRDKGLLFKFGKFLFHPGVKGVVGR